MHVHTAYQLHPSHFTATTAGGDGSYEKVFPDWSQHDRLGVVVDRPLGGVGASLLIQCAVAGYYATNPARVGASYPEVYVFHVGDFHGSHSWFDVFPPRKEVEVPDEAKLVLEAINDRGISRLAVPDGPVERVLHRRREPASALERIVTAYAYSPTGRVRQPDLEIAATSQVTEENVRTMLFPEDTKELQQRLISAIHQHAGNAKEADEELILPKGALPPRDFRDTVYSERLSGVFRGGYAVETYRSVAVADALGMLHRRGAS